MSKDDDIRRSVLRRARTEGLEVAYQTALDICRDAKAPAPARATALTALFRVAGGFGKQEDESDKDPSEMSAAELNNAVARIMRRQASSYSEHQDGDGSIFE